MNIFFFSEESATLTYRLGMNMLREDDTSQDSYTNDSETRSSLPSANTVSSFSVIRESSSKPTETSKKDDTQKPKVYQ